MFDKYIGMNYIRYIETTINQGNDMTLFEQGKTYTMNWITNSDLKTEWTVLRRTKKTIWIIDQNGTKKMNRIKIYDDCEYVLPFGDYSMSPSLRAKNII